MMYDAPRTNTKITVELHELIESGVKLWNFDYPSYYEGDEKLAFEQKVIDHYYFRQIGQETTGRFLHSFRTRIREIMPYYIQLYESCRFLDFKDDDIMKSYDLTETYSEERSDSGTSSSSGSSSSQSDTENTSDGSNGNVRRFSNTPQGSISNLDKYLTEATQDDGTSNAHDVGSASASGSSSVSEESANEGRVEHTLRRVGNIGVQPLGDELAKNRAAILNVDKMIIEELSDLFLGLY